VDMGDSSLGVYLVFFSLVLLAAAIASVALGVVAWRRRSRALQIGVGSWLIVLAIVASIAPWTSLGLSILIGGLLGVFGVVTIVAGPR
jgi:hypothetical protein